MKLKKFMKLATTTVAIAVCFGFILCPQVLSAEKVKLSVSHLGAITTPIVAASLGLIVKDLEDTGKVKMITYGSGSAYGNPRKALMQVERGVVDMAFGTPIYAAGQLPLNLLMIEPFVTSDFLAATRAYMSLLRKKGPLADEWPATVKVLHVACLSSYGFHAKSAMTKMEDVKGKRIQVTSTQVKNIVSALGGSVAALPIPTMYENLQKGVVDAGVTPWPGLYSWKLLEVTKHHLDIKISVPTNYLIINKKKCDSLPAEVKAVLDRWSTTEAAIKIAMAWKNVGDKAIAEAKAKGHIITVPTKEKRMALKKRFQYLTDNMIKKHEAKGLPAREVYNDIVKAVAAEETAGN